MLAATWAVAFAAISTWTAGTYAFYLPLVAALLACVLVFFESIHASHFAADGGTARIAAIATVSAVRALAAAPFPWKTKARNANVFGLHQPAVFFYFFRNPFWAADHFGTVAAAPLVVVTVATGILATCRDYLLTC